MFSFCLILLMHFSDYESLLLLSLFFFLFLLRTCQKKRSVDWTENMNLNKTKMLNSPQDVMLGSNPSLPALERCLDCPPLHCCVFVPFFFSFFFLLCQCLACCLWSERSIPPTHTHTHTHSLSLSPCTIYVIFYTLVPLGGRKPPETSENESN